LEAEYHNAIDEFEKAKNILVKIIDEVPAKEGNEQYFYEIGYAFHKLGDYKTADSYFAKIGEGEYKARLKLFSAETYELIAETYFAVYDYEKTDDYLKIAFAINPTLTSAFELQTKLAAVKTPKKQLIEAAENVIKSTQKDGNTNIEKYYELAVLYYQERDYDAATFALDKYLEKKPMDMPASFLKAACEHKLKKDGPATQLLARSVKNPGLTPELKAKIYFLQGLTYKSIDKLDLAEEAFKNANVGPFKPAAMNELEEIFKTRLKQSMSGK
jgi:tetratricopeptide (TPR) repeat protein